MITNREWSQICAALANGPNITVNGEIHAPLKTVLMMIRPFAEQGCDVEFQDKGKSLNVTWTGELK